MTTLNNASARLTVNAKLIEAGWPAISADHSYEQFANELRKITAQKQVWVAFASRPDAVAYVRLVARGAVAIPQFRPGANAA